MIDLWPNVFLQHDGHHVEQCEAIPPEGVRIVLVFFVGFSLSHLCSLSASLLETHQKKCWHPIVISFLDLCFRPPKKPTIIDIYVYYYIKPPGKLMKTLMHLRFWMIQYDDNSHGESTRKSHLEAQLNSPSAQAKKAGYLSIPSIEKA